jgi:PucR C-terminal helix-turn-helix domain
VTLDEVAEGLSAELGRPVVIEDAELRPLAYSRQTGALDPVRTETILHREASAEVLAALLARGIAEARGPLRLDSPEVGMTARVCVPIAGPRGPRGYLWVIDDPPLSDAEEATAAAAGHAAEAILAAAEAAVDDRGAREQALLEALLGGEADPAELETAAARLGVLGRRPLVVALAAGDEDLTFNGRGVLSGEVGGRLAIVSPHVEEDLRSVLGPGTRLGIGHPFSDLADAPGSLRRAELALRVARPVAAWDELGADRLLARLPRDAALADLPDGIRRLLDDEHATLRETLGAYLDHAGDVKATAEALSLHRAGLYYRLRRIEELAGVDLHRGEDRLLCQIALRLAER